MRGSDAPVLLCQRVSKWYGPVIGVNQVTLELRPGITGLVGSNGAGKSTLMRLITGHLRPDLGRVGADPGHTRQWFLDMIRDPQAENRLARMPKFAGKLSEGDLLALADYLASLKGS